MFHLIVTPSGWVIERVAVWLSKNIQPINLNEMKEHLKNASKHILESWQMLGAQNRQGSPSFDYGKGVRGLSRSRERDFTLYGDARCCFYVGRSKSFEEISRHYMPTGLLASDGDWFFWIELVELYA
ncbi:hypothetical protein QQP08_013827 [Theobroma cacao]|uniref:Uncharacterized protein n=1 Tax=Theobroma cacao TaxID=3641 RepID=A0A061EKX9_THECC|nr:Uncharacterized protein TCM_020500 [Theobroma cacao]WRX21340.1 hypothetical protein QQP08_013827 [Theobroma cacao]